MPRDALHHGAPLHRGEEGLAGRARRRHAFELLAQLGRVLGRREHAVADELGRVDLERVGHRVEGDRQHLAHELVLVRVGLDGRADAVHVHGRTAAARRGALRVARHGALARRAEEGVQLHRAVDHRRRLVGGRAQPAE